MNPSQVANVLRKIAGAIDNSKQPDKRMVIADLKTVIAQMQQGQQQQQQQGQQQQQALPKSQGGMSMLKKFLEDAEKALEKGDDGAFKGALEKLQKAAV
jgi:esterase/lipase